MIQDLHVFADLGFCKFLVIQDFACVLDDPEFGMFLMMEDFARFCWIRILHAIDEPWYWIVHVFDDLGYRTFLVA